MLTFCCIELQLFFKLENKLRWEILAAVGLLGFDVYLSACSLLLWWDLLVSFLTLAHMKSIDLAFSKFFATNSSFWSSCLNALDILVAFRLQLFQLFILLKHLRGDWSWLGKQRFVWNWWTIIILEHLNWVKSVAEHPILKLLEALLVKVTQRTAALTVKLRWSWPHYVRIKVDCIPRTAVLN